MGFLCQLSSGDIETGYHFLLVGKNLAHVRSIYILSNWYVYYSVQKLI